MGTVRTKSTATMQAAVIREHGGLEKIALEDWPRPTLRSGWVLIRVRACSLNFHDIFTRRGMPGIRIPLPIIIGSDIAGEIAEIGDGVRGWNTGERVLVDPQPCPETDNKLIGEQFNGGRAEYCAVHSSQLVRLPDNVSYEIASGIPLAYATAHRMMHTRGQVTSGETALILGASGGVGTACVLIAKLLGATVIACAGSEAKTERLRALGADYTINYRASDMREEVWRLIGRPRLAGSGGVDVAVNCTGGGTWKDTIRCLRKSGRLLTCGATAGYDESIDARYVWSFEHSLIGSDGWQRSDIDALLAYARTGQLVPVIDRVMPLRDIQEAERLLEEREAFGKVVVTP